MSCRRIGVVLGLAFAVPACTSLPRINTSSSCNGSTPSHLLVEAVDATGQHVPFAPVSVISDNRATRLEASTSSVGTAKLPLQAGSYRVSVGDDWGDWQAASRSFNLRPGCTITARAQLIRHENDPVDTPLRKRVAR
jgi:hypothetical protein